MDRFVPRAAALIGAGAAGAGVALAVAFAAGGFGSTKTTEIRQITLPATSISNSTTPIRYGEMSIGEIYKDVAPGVVQITATSEVVTPQDPVGNPFGPTVQTQQALGSGFVIDKAGHVVTNYHVVAGRQVRSRSVSRTTRASRRAMVGSDPSTDLAVLQVNASARALTPLPLGDSDAVKVGDSRRRHRQPVRPRPHGDRRHRQRPPAPDHLTQRVRDRPRDPDRRADQPRQLRRAAARLRGPGHRRQLADRDRRHRPGQRRHRLRHPLEHGQDRDRADDQDRQCAARLPRDQRPDRSRRISPGCSGSRSSRGCSSRA